MLWGFVRNTPFNNKRQKLRGNLSQKELDVITFTVRGDTEESLYLQIALHKNMQLHSKNDRP